MSHPTKIEPAPLPNGGKGGFLGTVGNENAKVQQAEREALKAKHKVDIEKLVLKHRKQNAPKPAAKKGK